MDLAGRWVGGDSCPGTPLSSTSNRATRRELPRRARITHLRYLTPHKPLRPGGLSTTKPTICQFCTWHLEVDSQAAFPHPQPPANWLNSRLNRHANAPREGASRGAREGDQPAPCSQLSPTSWCGCSYGAEAKSTRRRAQVSVRSGLIEGTSKILALGQSQRAKSVVGK